MRVVPVAAVASDDPPELIFQWERRSRVHWRLAAIIAWSLLAHAASFYVLQVAYTPTGAQLPPPAQVVMVPLDQPGNEAFARWLAMADPSLIVQPSGPSPRDTLAALNFSYQPSYKVARSGFKSLDPSPGEGIVTAPPRPRVPGPVPLNLVSPARRTPFLPAAHVGQPTHVTLVGDLKTRLTAALPTVDFKTAKGSEPLEPTTFLVGVRPEGGLPFLFQQSKPGDAAADEYARAYLAQLSFLPAASNQDEMFWGWAEFAWGNEAYQ